MKKIIMFAALLSSPAFAEVPLPGTSREGPIEVTPKGQDKSTFDLQEYKVIPRADSRRVQRVLNALRADLASCKARQIDSAACDQKVQDLEGQLRAALAELEVLKRQVADHPAQNHLNRVAIYGGVAPDGVTVSDIPNGKKAQLDEAGPAVALSYGRLLNDRFSLTGFMAMATAKPHVLSGYLGAGYDF